MKYFLLETDRGNKIPYLINSNRVIDIRDTNRNSAYKILNGSKVEFSSVWASVNTFSAASGDFAKVTAAFLPLIPTKPKKAKMTVICENFSLFLTKPRKPE